MTQAARKHTPGPWGVKPDPKDETRVLISGLDWFEFASVVVRLEEDGQLQEECDPTGEANARLIAAAPDLLDALKALINDDSLYEHWLNAKGIGLTMQEWKRRSALIDAAIGAVEKAGQQ